MAVSANVLSLFRSQTKDWSQQELAEFYRVESALLQGGLAVVTQRGVSDEGDPWFVFCRQDNDDVIVHFARIDHQYVVVSSAFSGTARGQDFQSLIRALLNAHPFMLPRNAPSPKIFLHPAALLIALVATSFVASSDKDSVQTISHHGDEKDSFLQFFKRADFAALSAVAIVAAWIEHYAESNFKLVQDAMLLHNNESNSDLLAHHLQSVDNSDSFASVLTFFAIETHANHNAGGDVFGQTLNSELASNGDRGSVAVPVEYLSSTSQFLLTDGLEKATGSNGIFGFLASDKIDFAKFNQGDLTLNEGDAIVAPSQIWHVVSQNQPTSAATSNAESSLAATSSETSSSGSGSVFPVSTYAAHIVAGELNSNLNLSVATLSPGQLAPADNIQQTLLQIGFDPSQLHGAASSPASVSPEDNTSGTKANSPVLIAAPADSSQIVAPSSNPAPSPPVSSQFLVGGSFDSQATQTLVAFIHDTTNIEVAISGSNVMVIDASLIHTSITNFSVETWTMSDGSTISIVGTIPANSAFLS